jgi:NADH dehydrogenase
VIATKRVAHHGFLAWLLWWAVHIMFLVGFKNRLMAMFHWAWQWLSFKRGARLITGDVGKLPPINAITPDGEPVMPPSAQPVALTDETVARSDGRSRGSHAL